jgi:chromate transporter
MRLAESLRRWTPRAEAAPGSALEVLAAATRLGLTSFGGPIAHLGYFRREYVERRGWLDDPAYAELVALCQSLPGPASSQLGIAIGTTRAGIPGGIAAWLGFTLPSAIALVVFAALTSSVDLQHAGWVHGLKLAAVAVVAQAVYLMARRLAPDWRRRAMATIAAGVALAWPIPLAQVAIIAAGAAAGWALVTVPGAPASAGAPPVERPAAGPLSRRVGVAALAGFLGLLVGLPIMRALDGGIGAVVATFYQVGALVFGGGHVVLPLLHSTVVDPGWVSDDQFLAGYGAAQAVPGPLFSFAAYLGAVSRVGPGGWIGAAIALLAIYVPSFLLIFGTLPFWHTLRRSELIRRALAGTNAAVVGLLVAALYTPIWTSAVQAPLDVLVAAVGLLALASGRVPPIVIVAATALVGQLGA